MPKKSTFRSQRPSTGGQRQPEGTPPQTSQGSGFPSKGIQGESPTPKPTKPSAVTPPVAYSPQDVRSRQSSGSWTSTAGNRTPRGTRETNKPSSGASQASQRSRSLGRIPPAPRNTNLRLLVPYLVTHFGETIRLDHDKMLELIEHDMVILDSKQLFTTLALHGDELVYEYSSEFMTRNVKSLMEIKIVLDFTVHIEMRREHNANLMVDFTDFLAYREANYSAVQYQYNVADPVQGFRWATHGGSVTGSNRIADTPSIHFGF